MHPYTSRHVIAVIRGVSRPRAERHYDMTVRRDIAGIIIAASAILFGIVMMASGAEQNSLYRMEFLLSTVTIFIAIITTIACTARSGVKYSRFFKLPLAHIGIGLMILQMLIALLFVLVIRGHEGIAAAISYPLILVAVILMLIRYDPKKAADAQAAKEALAARHNPFLEELADRFDEIAASASEADGIADAKLAKAIKVLASTTRSIDQMDHPFLDGIDQELIDQTMELDSYVLNGEKDKVQPMIETLMGTLGRRNEKCKQMH